MRAAVPKTAPKAYFRYCPDPTDPDLTAQVIAVILEISSHKTTVVLSTIAIDCHKPHSLSPILLLLVDILNVQHYLHANKPQ